MFTKAIVRDPVPNYADGLSTGALGKPDYARALRQHTAYCEALEACGLELTRLAADERFPDSTFVEDTAVIVQELAVGKASAIQVILTRPGAASRVGEMESIKEALSVFCPQLKSIHEPGTLDGGDVCEAGNHFFIGVSERTNEAGAEQLAELLTGCGCTSRLVDIRNVKDLLHLKSGLAYLDENRLAVIETLGNRKEFHGYELVRVPAGEEYAANCVRINDQVLIAAGYPVFERTLRDRGYKTSMLEMSEFQKMDGGLSCL